MRTCVRLIFVAAGILCLASTARTHSASESGTARALGVDRFGNASQIPGGQINDHPVSALSIAGAHVIVVVRGAGCLE